MMDDSVAGPLPLRLDSESDLVPAIVQNVRSGRVLMLGYMNAEALRRTRETGRVTFYSRSRQRLWTKGETSGNWLELVELLPDCDGDALLVRARAHGPTCHTGSDSCFAEPETIALGEVLGDLSDLIEVRRRRRPEGSYTVALLQAGTGRIAQKVAEEAVELALEAVAGGDRLAEEAADLLYHLLLLLAAADRKPEAVAAILRERRRVSANR